MARMFENAAPIAGVSKNQRWRSELPGRGYILGITDRQIVAEMRRERIGPLRVAPRGSCRAIPVWSHAFAEMARQSFHSFSSMKDWMRCAPTPIRPRDLRAKTFEMQLPTANRHEPPRNQKIEMDRQPDRRIHSKDGARTN